MAFDVVDDLLTEYLSEHFIPDILIDIFTTEDDEYTVSHHPSPYV